MNGYGTITFEIEWWLASEDDAESYCPICGEDIERFDYLTTVAGEPWNGRPTSLTVHFGCGAKEKAELAVKGVSS